MKPNTNKLNFQKYLLIFILTLIFYRVLILIIGDRSVYFLGHEIHHLFFGILILLFACFVKFFSTHKELNNWALVAFGVSTGMIMDQFIYLIYTPGDHLSYLSNISFYGMIISSILLISIFYFIFKRITK